MPYTWILRIQERTVLENHRKKMTQAIFNFNQTLRVMHYLKSSCIFSLSPQCPSLDPYLQRLTQAKV